ncbi:MAG: efflux RND transporter periplasmic adaptor subunit [Planctomycetaceae bacterium]|jgi:RND family efflux transporter MFP subunit|nr:efflux RND transporter periplasmic adaptor subunit [Planctomycetaceae bacterium]
MSTSKHRSVILLFSVALTFFLIGASSVGYYVFAFYQPQSKVENQNETEKKTVPRPPSLVRVDSARKELINTIRPFHGKLLEVQLARISTEISGLVVALPIEVGQKVKGGETLIAQIDKTWLELTIAQTEAEIKILEKQCAFQVSESERIESLALSRAVSESELNNQRTLVEQFRQNLEKAIIANKEAKEKLKRTTILAPFDGYVIRRDTGLGELLAPGTSIAEIVSLGFIDARVNVVEEYINHIKIGDEMPIIIDELGIKVVGKIHAIVPYDLMAPRSFPVIVRLEDRNGELKVGMSATALVAITDPNEEIVVSKDAVLMKPDGSTVWVAVKTQSEKNDSGISKEEDSSIFIAKPVPVKITAEGITSYGIEPETEEGQAILIAGAKTVIEGAERLIPDQRIRIEEINPKLLENLPPSTGHRIIKPKARIGK